MGSETAQSKVAHLRRIKAVRRTGAFERRLGEFYPSWTVDWLTLPVIRIPLGKNFSRRAA
jgi:hypothetical protein